jgi:hypothetical protein
VTRAGVTRAGVTRAGVTRAGVNCAGPWRIGGASVLVDAEDPRDLQPLRQLLEGFTLAPGETGRDWLVSLQRAAPRSLRAGDGLRQGKLLSGEPYEARIGQRSRRFLVDGRLELALDLGKRRALCRLADDGAALLRGESGLLLIDAVAESQGQHMVHAALLALPSSLPRGGLVLLGDSGAGKTTTSLALAQGGFALGGDDATILCAAPPSLAAWALPRVVKVHREVGRLLPSLAAHLPDDREESLHEAADLPGVAVLRPADSLLPLRAMAWLGERSPGPHRYRRLMPIEMLERLARRDLHAPRVLADASVRRQLRLFAAAASSLVALDLSLGRELPALPAWLAGVLAAELQG